MRQTAFMNTQSVHEVKDALQFHELCHKAHESL